MAFEAIGGVGPGPLRSNKSLSPELSVGLHMLIVPYFPCPAVVVLIAHDVVFPQVGAALYLNQLYGDFAAVGEAVFAAQGDVGALVFANQFLDAVFFHHGCPSHHNPVLGAVVVHLQRQAGAGIHHDLLHLPALPFGDAVVGAPGAVDPAVGFALGGPLLLQ